MNRCLVTGGGGFVGDKLCRYLLHKGCPSVTSYDIYHSSDNEPLPEGILEVTGDICDYNNVLKVITDAAPSVVFHLASYGMSGKEMLDRKRIEAVNVKGTENVINACIKGNVQCLVYTSTYNVIFGGQEIVDGDESLPYFPLEKHVDNYSRTKSIAEQMVLGANGSHLRNGKFLRVCSLRCAGIYGEGERRHLPRIVSYIEKGMFSFTYGSKTNLVDFLHWDNFVLAHYLAAKALHGNPTAVTGKPYFISDGKPINNFVFFKPLVEGLGYSYPTLKLPLTLIFYIAFLIELVHCMVSRYFYNFQPLLTRAEVFKTGVTHYFNIKAAKTDLKYQPMPKDLNKTVKWFKDRGHGRKNTKSRPSAMILIVLVAIIWLLFFCVLPTVG